MTIGSVVCEVNGWASSADKVLDSLERGVAARGQARQRAPVPAVHKGEIEKQVTLFVEAELAFAAAKKNLLAHKQSLAESRHDGVAGQQITAAGGSLEQASVKAAAEGKHFEELVEDEYRTNMVRMYYQKALHAHCTGPMPRTMRRYYNQNVNTLLAEHGPGAVPRDQDRNDQVSRAGQIQRAGEDREPARACRATARTSPSSRTAPSTTTRTSCGRAATSASSGAAPSPWARWKWPSWNLAEPRPGHGRRPGRRRVLHRQARAGPRPAACGR